MHKNDESIQHETSTTSASSNRIDTTITAKIAKRMCRSTKRIHELITLSQAARTIVTLQLSSNNLGSVQIIDTSPPSNLATT